MEQLFSSKESIFFVLFCAAYIYWIFFYVLRYAKKKAVSNLKSKYKKFPLPLVILVGFGFNASEFSGLNAYLHQFTSDPVLVIFIEMGLLILLIFTPYILFKWLILKAKKKSH